MSARGLRYRSRRMAARASLALLGAAVAWLSVWLSLLVTSAGAVTITTSTEKVATGPFADQGGSFDYRSYVTSVTPNAPGLGLQILEFADRLLLTNHTGKTVTIYGYQGEPYARVLANGTAERNVRSPATYLNESFYGDIKVPKIANPQAAPEWQVVDRTGQFEWHDHRIHWASPSLPPAVKNKSKRTLVFNWEVPIAVGASKGAIYGQLWWTPESSSAPTAVIVLGAVIVVAGLLFVLYVRRRRARSGAGGGGEAAATGTPGGPPADGSRTEAW